MQLVFRKIIAQIEKNCSNSFVVTFEKHTENSLSRDMLEIIMTAASIP